MEKLSLYELNALVRGVLEDTMDEDYWVCGELAEGRVGYGGHFYGELVQKDDSGRNLVARARINIWARTYNLLALRFRHETGQELRAGMQVLMRVRVSFHEQYGYALNVQDIDSAYTLGDMARKRQEILHQLEEDGILHDNQTLSLPLMTQRIAVVSSATAAGYGDFCNQLQNNEYGLRFEVTLFPAVMQGSHVEESVIAALDSIVDAGDDAFDVVVIIRGGGATSDLSDFDSYPLAACIAQYPLPVITGIGHERDETVLDFVAHTHLKTPTAVAAFLIDHQAQQLVRLQDIEDRLPKLIIDRLQLEKHRLELLEQALPARIATRMQREHHRVEMLAAGLPIKAQMVLERQRHQLEMLEVRLKSLDPELLLKRGYSITLCGGKIVRSVNDICADEVLTTKLEDGEVLSKILVKNCNPR